MTAALGYLSAPALTGTWPMTATGLAGPSGSEFTIFPRSLTTQATMLGARRQPAGGFDVAGKSFTLDVDASTYTVGFAVGPLSIDALVTEINTQATITVAYNSNGFLILKSPTMGDGSYLRVRPVSDLTILPELGLFSFQEARNGDIVQAQHVDPMRQIAAPGQLALNYGEQFDANTYNRMALQLALNADYSNDFINYKQIAIEKDLTLGAYSPLSSPGVALTDTVFVGGTLAPTSGQLEELFAILDSEGNELMREVETSSGISTGFVVTATVDPDTKMQYVQVAAGHPGMFTSTDTTQDYFVRLTGLTGTPLGNNKLFKIIEWISDTRKVGIKNVDPLTGDIIEMNESGGSIVLERVNVTSTRILVTEVDDTVGGTRVEAVEQPRLVGAAITRIEGNNRIVCNGVNFVTTNVVVGDLIDLAGAGLTRPYSNNGSYRVAKVVDPHTIEVISDAYGPVMLNPIAGSGYGTIDIHSDGKFFLDPFLKFNIHPATGTIVRVVYLGLSNLRDASNDPAFFSGGSIKYAQEASFKVQKTLMAVIGPSTTSFDQYLYSDYRKNLEDIYFRVSKEHNDRGRHTTIRPDKIDMESGVTGETVSVRNGIVGEDTSSTVEKLTLRASTTSINFQVQGDGRVGIGYRAGADPTCMLDVLASGTNGVITKFSVGTGGTPSKYMQIGVGTSVAHPYLYSSTDAFYIGNANVATPTLGIVGMSRGYLWGSTTGTVLPTGASTFTAALTLEDGSAANDHRVALAFRKSFVEDFAAPDRRVSMVFAGTSNQAQHIFGRITGGRASADGAQGYLAFRAGPNGNTYDHMKISYDGVISTYSGIELGILATGNRYAGIDFHGDDTYTDFCFRILRNNTGQNAPSQIIHRGTGAFQLWTMEAAQIDFVTTNSTRVTIQAAGNVLCYNKIMAENYTNTTASFNGFSIEVGGEAPTGSNNQATIHFHDFANIAHQLRFTNGVLYWEADGSGYGTSAYAEFSVSGGIMGGSTTRTVTTPSTLFGNYMTDVTAHPSHVDNKVLALSGTTSAELWLCGAGVAQGAVASISGGGLDFWEFTGAVWKDALKISGVKLATNGSSVTLSPALEEGGMTLYDDNGTVNPMILTLRSSGVANGMTTYVPTDAFFTIRRTIAAGCASVYGTGGSGSSIGLALWGVPWSPNSAGSTGGTGAVTIYGAKASGAGFTDVLSTENLLAIRNTTEAKLVMKGDGTVYLNGNLYPMTPMAGFALLGSSTNRWDTVYSQYGDFTDDVTIDGIVNGWTYQINQSSNYALTVSAGNLYMSVLVNNAIVLRTGATGQQWVFTWDGMLTFPLHTTTVGYTPSAGRIIVVYDGTQAYYFAAKYNTSSGLWYWGQFI
jgi:hypothetical protein